MLLLTSSDTQNYIKIMLDWIKNNYQIAVLIGVFLTGVKSLINNLGNTLLEEKLSTPLTRFRDRLLLMIIATVLYTVLLSIGLEKKNFYSVFLFSVLLVIGVWILVSLILFFFAPRYSYFIKLENEGYWELVRYNKKMGYLFKQKVKDEPNIIIYDFIHEVKDEKFRSEKYPCRIKSYINSKTKIQRLENKIQKLENKIQKLETIKKENLEK